MEFEKYFHDKLKTEHEMHKDLPYSKEQLREIYLQDWEWIKSAPNLELRLEPQQLDYDTAQYYLPEKWEVSKKGRLLYSDEELERTLKLIIFNLGVRKSLSVIPRKLIEQYLSHNKSNSSSGKSSSGGRTSGSLRDSLNRGGDV
jgi:hypothetical protein